VNFAEYRPYRPGDDIRKIDWKVFGRLDRFFVKEFEGETNTSIHLILDCSRSMAYGSRGIRKLEYGQYLGGVARLLCVQAARWRRLCRL